MYSYGKVTTRKEDNRQSCSVNGKNQYLSRVLYCNYYALTLEDIKGLTIHHKDGDKFNNIKENLELLNLSDHLKKHRNGMGKRNKKIRKKFSEIQKELWANGFYKNRKQRKSKYDKDMPTIIALRKLGYRKTTIAKELGIPIPTIQSIIKRNEKPI